MRVIGRILCMRLVLRVGRWNRPGAVRCLLMRRNVEGERRRGNGRNGLMCRGGVLRRPRRCIMRCRRVLVRVRSRLCCRSLRRRRVRLCLLLQVVLRFMVWGLGGCCVVLCALSGGSRARRPLWCLRLRVRLLRRGAGILGSVLSLVRVCWRRVVIGLCGRLRRRLLRIMWCVLWVAGGIG